MTTRASSVSCAERTCRNVWRGMRCDPQLMYMAELNSTSLTSRWGLSKVRVIAPFDVLASDAVRRVGLYVISVVSIGITY